MLSTTVAAGVDDDTTVATAEEEEDVCDDSMIEPSAESQDNHRLDIDDDEGGRSGVVVRWVRSPLVDEFILLLILMLIFPEPV